MDKEQIKSYVQYGLNSSQLTKKLSIQILFINLVVLVIAIILHPKLAFILTIVAIALANIAMVIVIVNKWSPFVKLFAIAILLFFFCVALNCFVFGLLKIADIFIWWQFLLSIAIQLLFWAGTFIFVFVRNSARKHDVNKKLSIIVASLATFSGGIGYVIGIFVTRTFLKDATLEIAMLVLASIINVLILLVGIGVVMAVYRAYLIKKHTLDVSICQTEQIENTETEQTETE
ncbi:MAG: hypothetical protein FWH03_08890 [Firmicutes bacterium]|nr:hypothetical protein [Bacillota bacterium]